jgi:hypothetical protein
VTTEPIFTEGIRVSSAVITRIEGEGDIKVKGEDSRDI